MTGARLVLSALAATAFLLSPIGSSQPGAAKDAGKHITSELNGRNSELVRRMHLRETAGVEPDTGAYFVKIFVVTRGEECDVDGAQCEGRDLLVSVTSLDLYGDHALFRITGIDDWTFVKWTTYAEFDSPEYFTSFQVNITMRPGQMLTECKGAETRAARKVTFHVSPWKLTCEYR